MLKSYLVLHITASLLDFISIHFHFYLRNLLILLHLGFRQFFQYHMVQWL